MLIYELHLFSTQPGLSNISILYFTMAKLLHCLHRWWLTIINWFPKSTHANSPEYGLCAGKRWSLLIIETDLLEMAFAPVPLPRCWNRESVANDLPERGCICERKNYECVIVALMTRCSLCNGVAFTKHRRLSYWQNLPPYLLVKRETELRRNMWDKDFRVDTRLLY